MLSFKKIYVPLLLLISFSLLMKACDVSDAENGNEGQFVVKMTDAPADYDAVYVEVTAVKVNVDSDSTDGVAEDGWVTISDENVRVDLLKLQNGETILLGKEQLQPGYYHQMRLILGDENALVIDGKTYALTTPSAQQSGLKLNIDARVEAGEVYVLLIDFNAAKSIVNAGKSGKYLLKPVIRTVSLGETGTVEGIVEPASFETTVLAIADGDTLTTFTEENGAFKFIGVLPNTYDLVFEPQNQAYADTTLANITVEVDENVDLDTVALPKK